MRCDKCGKNMKKPDTEENWIGCSMGFSCEPGQEDFFQKQLGKYQIGKTYNFCYECWLDSLFLGKFGEAPNEV